MIGTDDNVHDLYETFFSSYLHRDPIWERLFPPSRVLLARLQVHGLPPSRELLEISGKYSKNLVQLSIFNFIDMIRPLALKIRFLVQNKNLLDFKNLWI
jgi:hypothetical protein